MCTGAETLWVSQAAKGARRFSRAQFCLKRLGAVSRKIGGVSCELKPLHCSGSIQVMYCWGVKSVCKWSRHWPQSTVNGTDTGGNCGSGKDIESFYWSYQSYPHVSAYDHFCACQKRKKNINSGYNQKLFNKEWSR